MVKNIDWFKHTIVPSMKGFEINYSFFEKGDFGNLDRIEFEGKGIGGNVDFWDKGWLEVFIYNYKEERQLVHVLLEPNQIKEREEVFVKLQEVLS